MATTPTFLQTNPSVGVVAQGQPEQTVKKPRRKPEQQFDITRNGKVYTRVSELARKHGVSSTRINKMVKEKKLPAFYLGPSAYVNEEHFQLAFYRSNGVSESEFLDAINSNHNNESAEDLLS